MPTLLLGFLIIAAYFATDYGAAVDQFSWERHAKFLKLRNFRAFPLVLDNQFVLESDKSGYPQFFIYIYSLVGEIGRFWLGKYLYMLVLAIIYSFTRGSSENIEHSLLLVLAICSSPLVVAVNRQILPRFIGDLAVATFILNGLIGDSGQINNWLICFSLCYLVFGIHKMSLQLLVFSVFVIAPLTQGLGAIWQFSAFCCAGLIYTFVFPGYSFASYQFEEHKNILMFWKKNIDILGASVFGSKNQSLHHPRHRIRLLICYRLPLVLLPAIITLFFLGINVKWVNLFPVVGFYESTQETLIFFQYILTAIAIIFFSITCTTKRFAHFGSGLFYLTVPYIIGVVVMSMMVPDKFEALRALCLSNISIIFCLVAKNITSTRGGQEIGEFEKVCEILNGLPKLERLAVFPYTWSDRLGSLVHGKKVLWGAHGCGGWEELDSVFPIMKLSIHELLGKYKLEAIVVHCSEWDAFDEWSADSLTNTFALTDDPSFSSFRLYIKK